MEGLTAISGGGGGLRGALAIAHDQVGVGFALGAEERGVARGVTKGVAAGHDVVVEREACSPNFGHTRRAKHSPISTQFLKNK